MRCVYLTVLLFISNPIFALELKISGNKKTIFTDQDERASFNDVVEEIKSFFFDEKELNEGFVFLMQDAKILPPAGKLEEYSLDENSNIAITIWPSYPKTTCTNWSDLFDLIDKVESIVPDFYWLPDLYPKGMNYRWEKPAKAQDWLNKLSASEKFAIYTSK